MNISTMVSIATAATLVISVVSSVRLLHAGAGPRSDIIRGAFLQSALFGLILGFLLVPHGPPPPPLGFDILWLALSIAALEVVRLGVYLRLPFIPKFLLRYRLASLKVAQAHLARNVARLEKRTAEPS